MLNRIRKIVSVAPYNIVCEWGNGEVRTIQMESKLLEWSIEPHSVYRKLLDWTVFKNVALDAHSKTLFWDNLIKMQDASGNLVNAPLDIDPEILYMMSTPFIENKTAN